MGGNSVEGKSTYTICITAIEVYLLLIKSQSMIYINDGERQIDLLENWPPRKLASLKFVGGGKLASFDFFRGPNVYISLNLLSSAHHSSH